MKYNKCTKDIVSEAINLINKTREIQRLFKWMYSDATIYLERKYNRFAVSGQIAWRPEMIRAELSGEMGT